MGAREAKPPAAGSGRSPQWGPGAKPLVGGKFWEIGPFLMP